MRLVPCAAPLSVLVLACGGGTGGGGQPAPTTCPIPVARPAPSFAADLLPALQSSCGSAATSCHGGVAPTGHLAYSGTAAEVFAALVNVAPANAPAGWVLVKPGDAAHSWIYQKVTQDQPGGSGYGTRMPQGAPVLCPPTVETLATWIDGGALDN